MNVEEARPGDDFPKPGDHRCLCGWVGTGHDLDLPEALERIEELEGALYTLLSVFDDWVLAKEPLGVIGRGSARVKSARAVLSVAALTEGEKT